MKAKPVLVIGDTHCPAMLDAYPDFLVKVYDKHNCKSVIHIGDLVDLHCLCYHERNPDVSVASEVEDAIRQIRLLSDAFPRLTLLTGNHDALIQRQANTAGLPSRMLKAYKDVLDLPDRWTILPRFAKHVVNDVMYMHGDQGKGGIQAALKNAQCEFMSVVAGHYHTQSGVWYYGNESKLIYGMQVGCGIDRSHMQMEYGTKFSAKPVISCGVVFDSRTAMIETMVIGQPG